MIGTKIIVTYGPSISSNSVLEQVLKYADIVRVNFSHATKEEQTGLPVRIRAMAAKMHRYVALMADLPGAKVRVGTLTDPILVKKGDIVTFSSKASTGVVEVMQYPDFHKDAKVGVYIDIGDGTARFRIKKIDGINVVSKAVEDGQIGSRKGLSLIGAEMHIKALTDNDKKLARIALKNHFDLIGMSFVSSASDIQELRKSCDGMPIIAKIEREVAVHNIESIAKVADGLMVARGDLAMSIGLEHIPEAQRKIVNASRRAGKPVIVATQMLASMVHNISATRAEVNDIANAVSQGADILMLSDETSVGSYPIEAVKFLNKAAGVAEEASAIRCACPDMACADVAGVSAVSALRINKANCIFVPALTMSAAKALSSLRPSVMVVALATNDKTMSTLGMYYGVRPVHVKRYGAAMDHVMSIAKNIAKNNKINRYVVVSESSTNPGSSLVFRYVGR